MGCSLQMPCFSDGCKKISDMNPRFEVFMTPLLVLITAIKLHGDDLINLHDKECEIKLQKYCNTD